MDLLNFPIFDQDFYSMALLFFLNLFLLPLLFDGFIMAQQAEKDYLFTFFMISIVLFFISFTLKKFNLNIGLAIGLFAVFGIIRYRTESIPIREMTYLFIVIGISLMNAVVNSKLSYTEILFSNVAITWAVGFIEKVWHVKHEITKKIIYEKIENIKSENYELLIADLEERTGIPINKVTIDDIDFVKDCATLTIYYNLQPEKEKNEKKSYYYSSLYFLINSTINAQDATDFGSWNSIGVDYTFKKKLKLAIEYNMRFKENAAVLEERFSEVGLEYKIFKKFEIGGAVRFIDGNDTEGKRQGIRKYLRYQLDLSYKYKLDKFSINHRFRYQNKNESGVSEQEGDIPNANIRFRTGVEYNFKKWPLDPEFEAEIFRRVSKDQKNQFTKYRLTFGTTYNLKKFGKFGINYRYERSLIDGVLPMNLNVIELKYKYSIN